MGTTKSFSCVYYRPDEYRNLRTEQMRTQTHFFSTGRHQSVQLLSPAESVDQSLHAADHVPQLHDVLRPAAPGERPHQVPVDEQTRDGAANSSCQAGEGLHLQSRESTTAADL